MRSTFLAGMLLAVCLLPVGNAAHAQAAQTAAAFEQRFQAWEAQYEQALQLHLRGVASSGQPRDLYAAALLWPSGANTAPSPDSTRPAPAALDERSVWMQAAIDARPRDPLIARFEAMGCPGYSVQCDVAGALAFLQREAPENLDVQLLAFIDAQQRGDAKASAKAWRAAADAARYDTMRIELGGLLADALADLPVPPSDPQLRDGIARTDWPAAFDARAWPMMTASQVLWTSPLSANLGVVARHCSTAQTREDRERWDDCKSVFALMARDGSDLIGRMIGVGFMARLTAGTPQALPWHEQKRQLQWLQTESARYMPPATDDIAPDTYLGWQLRDGEIVAMQRLLEAYHRPLTAPAGWQQPGPVQSATREALSGSR